MVASCARRRWTSSSLPLLFLALCGEQRVEGAGGVGSLRGKPAPSRLLAHKVLLRCARDGAFAGRALDTALLRKALPPPDAGLATQLVYGVLRTERLLDHALVQLAPRLDKIDNATLVALRIGAYELLEMRTADHAAVDQAVSLERRPHVRKFVNGVLRNLVRRRDAGQLVQPEDTLQPLDAMSIRNSMPQWLLSKLCKELGIDGVSAWAAANQIAPPLAIRVNTLRSTAEDVATSLSASGAEVESVPGIPNALYVRGAGSVSNLPGFAEGLWTVQDPAAQLIGHLAQPPSGGLVLEVCAAPGGKTAHLAELMANRGKLLALDKPSKVELVLRSAKRLGLDCVQAVGGDGTNAAELLMLLRKHSPSAEGGEDGGPMADAVVCDAPCSGLGTLRRNPELRQSPEARVRELCSLQGALLDAVAACVKPGGSLTYSTCSPLRDEGEGTVAAFLARAAGRDFRCEPIEPNLVLEPFICDADELGGERRCVRSWTHLHGCDSFFATRLTRTTTPKI